MGVDDVQRSLGDAGMVAPDAVGARDLALWVYIGKQRYRQPASCGPGGVGVDAVGRDRNQLGAAASELVQLLLVEVKLQAAAGAPVERVEGEHDRLAARVAQADRVAVCVWQRK